MAVVGFGASAVLTITLGLTWSAIAATLSPAGLAETSPSLPVNFGAAAAGVTSHASNKPAPAYPPFSSIVPVNPDLMVPVARSEYSNIYAASAGLYEQVTSTTPTNFKPAGGSWTPIQTAVARNKSGNLTVADNPLNPQFGQAADSSKLVSVSNDGYPVSFSLKGAAAATGSVNSKSTPNEVDYKSAFPHTELTYQVQSSAVKESLVLAARPSAATSWTWVINAPGLSLSKSSDGEIDMAASDGTIEYSIPTPFMTDSSGIANLRGAAQVDVDTTLTRVGANWDLTLTPSATWLADPSRVYPVTVDPTLTASDGSFHAYKSSGATRTDAVQTGNARDPGDDYWRTVVKYTYSSLTGKQVVGAKLTGTYGGSGTANAVTGTVYQAKCTNAYACEGTNLGSLPIGSTYTGTGHDSSAALGQAYSDQVNANTFGMYLELAGQNTAGAYTYKELDTSLALTYVAYPSVTISSPANGAVDQSVTPTLVATGVNPTALPLTYDYLISDNSSFPTGDTWTSPDTASSTYVVPTSAGLVAGRTYYWEAEVSDEYQGLYGTDTHRLSSTQSFTTAAPPDQPSALAITSAYDADPSSNGVTDSTPFFSATVTDADGHDLTTTFEVHNSTTVSATSLKLSCVAGTVSSGDTAACGSDQQLADGTYYVRAKANDGIVDGPWSTWSTITVSASPFAPATLPTSLYHAQAAHVLDTRDGTGGNTVAPFAPGWHSVAISGVGGLPSTGITSVAVTLSAIAPAAAGLVHADADGVSSPNTATDYLDYSAQAGSAGSETSAIIPVGADGKIQVNPTTTTDLMIDVQGYYSTGSTGGAGYVPVLLTTVADTTTGVGGVPQAQVAAGSVVSVPVGGVGLVPANATSVVLSVVESNATSPQGSIAVYPAGAAAPNRTLDWSPTANNWAITVPLPASGIVDASVVSGGPADLQLAVEGFFTAPTGTPDGAFQPSAARVFDSVAAGTPAAADDTTSVQLAGVDGIPDVGSGITAVALRISQVTAGVAPLQVYPDEAIAPADDTGDTGDDADTGDNAGFETGTGDTSSPGLPPTGYVIVPIGDNGIVNLFNAAAVPVDFAVDIEGWYSGTAPATVTCPNGVYNGSWTATPPTSSFNCTVVAPAALTVGGMLDVVLDDGDSTDVPLSTTASTTLTVPVAAGAAAHEIDVVVDPGTAGQSTGSTFSFGSGNWASANLVPNVGNGAVTNDSAPSLFVATDGAPLADGTTLQYMVSANADGSSPMVVSPWTAGDLEGLDGLLTAGTTYYWKVQVRGPNSLDGSSAQLTSPWWSFVAGPAGTTGATNATVGSVQANSATVKAAAAAPLRPLGTFGSAAKVLCAGYSSCASKEPDGTHGFNGTTNRTSWWGAYAGHNCTNYVAYVMIHSDGLSSDHTKVSWFKSAGGVHFGDGVSTSSTQAKITPGAAWLSGSASVGSIAWSKTIGHVAMVEGVSSSGNTITISEDSYGHQAFDWETYSKSNAPSYQYIHVNAKISGVAALQIVVSSNATYDPNNQDIRAGSSLTTNAGTIGITTYQWKVNGSAVPGATHASFVLPLADSRQKITVSTTTQLGNVTEWQTSKATTFSID